MTLWPRDEYVGGTYFHGTPFRRAIEEGLIDGQRFLQVGVRGPMYGDDDFDFHQVSRSPGEDPLRPVVIRNPRVENPGATAKSKPSRAC